MRCERVTASLLASVFLLLMWAYAPAKAQEAVSDSSLPHELVCMRDCMPTCTASSNRDSASCERHCKRRCGFSNTFELEDLEPFLPKLRDLTGVIGPSFVVICGGAACVCNGVASCNWFVAECPANYVLQCSKFNDQGQPIACSCVNPG